MEEILKRLHEEMIIRKEEMELHMKKFTKESQQEEKDKDESNVFSRDFSITMSTIEYTNVEDAIKQRILIELYNNSLKIYMDVRNIINDYKDPKSSKKLKKDFTKKCFNCIHFFDKQDGIDSYKDNEGKCISAKSENYNNVVTNDMVCGGWSINKHKTSLDDYNKIT